MEDKHTPEPWQLKKLDINHSMIAGPNGKIIVPRMVTEPGSENEANAKLIQLAPRTKKALDAVKKLCADQYDEIKELKAELQHVRNLKIKRS